MGVGYNGRVLTKIRLKNFKLHEDTSIEAKRITVFIGPNNSGKSSIFQALLLVRQAAQRNDQFLCQPNSAYGPRPPEPYQYPLQMNIDVGSFAEIVRRPEDDVHVEFSGVVHPTRPLPVAHASASVELRVRDNQLVFHAGSIDLSGTQAKWEFVPGTPKSSPPVQLDAIDRRAAFILQVVGSFQLVAGGFQWAPDGRPSHETTLQLNEISQWLGTLPLNLLRSLHPVYPLRGFEEWGYQITDYPPESMELMTLHDRALALPNALAANRRLKERVSAQLEELLNISIDFETVPGKRLKIWAKPSNGVRETLYSNEGTGANQFPFILVPVLLAPANHTVLLCEPEAHLHPRGQSELVTLLLEIAKRQQLQFFFETHSEHVLHRLLHAVATGELAHDDLAIYYFENKQGRAEARKLNIDEKGGVEGGLPGFFDQSLDELTEYLEALKQPKA